MLVRELVTVCPDYLIEFECLCSSLRTGICPLSSKHSPAQTQEQKH